MAGDQPKPDVADTEKAKETATKIESIDQNTHGKAFVDQVNQIMKDQGLTGNDATSKLVIAQLERDKKLPRVLLEMGHEDIAGNLSGGDNVYNKEELEKVTRGEGSQYGTTTDAASKLMANAMLKRFDAISGLDSVDHSKSNTDPKNGEITIGDIRTYGGQQLDNQSDGSHATDVKRVENRAGVEQMLNAVSEAGENSPALLKKLKAGQPVSQQELKDALQEDSITRKVAQAQGLNEEQMAKLGLLSEKDKQAMEFLRDHYDKITGVKDGAKNIDGEVLQKYARIMGTSTEIATTNAADYKALDQKTEAQRTSDAEDPNKVDPAKAKEAADAIGKIPGDKHGAAYVSEVDKIMQEKGLHGNDASSKLLIAELERQGKLPQFLAETLGNNEAVGALADGKNGYTKEQLEKLAKGEGPTAGTQAADSTRLAAQALLDRYSAVADLDYIDHNDDGKNSARDDHKNLITVGDIKTYAGTQIEGDSGPAKTDRARVQFRNDVNQVLRTTSDIQDTDPAVFKKIRDGQPVSQQEIKDALQEDSITRKVAQAQGLNEEQMKKLNLMSPEQVKSLQYMNDHYGAITGMEDDSKGITNKLLDSYATNMGTNREIAKSQGEALKALDGQTAPPAQTGDLESRKDAVLDSVRALPPELIEPLRKDGVAKEEVADILAKNGDKLTKQQKDTFQGLVNDWDKIVGAGKTFDIDGQWKEYYPQHFEAADKAAQEKLKGDVSPLMNDKGEIDKAQLDQFLSNKDAKDSAKPETLAAAQYLKEHFDEISHDGQTITKDQLEAYKKLHKVADGSTDPNLEKAKQQVEGLTQSDSLKSGEPPYNLAARLLQERAKLTGETVDHNKIMREVARLVIVNEIGPESVRQNLQKMLDENKPISSKNLPKALNYVKVGQPLKTYSDQEKAELAQILAKKAADQQPPQDENYNQYGDR